MSDLKVYCKMYEDEDQENRYFLGVSGNRAEVLKEVRSENLYMPITSRNWTPKFVSVVKISGSAINYLLNGTSPGLALEDDSDMKILYCREIPEQIVIDAKLNEIQTSINFKYRFRAGLV